MMCHRVNELYCGRRAHGHMKCGLARPPRPSPGNNNLSKTKLKQGSQKKPNSNNKKVDHFAVVVKEGPICAVDSHTDSQCLG